METKKLTCCDLMIGDWVMAKKEPIRIATPFGNETVLHQLTIYGYTSDGAKAGPFLETELSPIPLTAEFLEKNGFYFGYTSQQEDAASQIGCSCEKAWTYDEGGGSIQVTFPNECDGGLIVLDDQSFDKRLEFVFANQIYVHELQHLIRICHVEKEIVL